MKPAAGRVLLAFGLLAALGCGARRPVPAAPSFPLTGCSEAAYQGRFSRPGEQRIRSFRLKLRLCGQGALLLEIRGGPGVAALVAGLRDGRALLLFPANRKAVEGPDSAEFWNRWTGVPLSGPLVWAMLREPAGGPGQNIEGWDLEVSPDPEAVFPQTVRARGEKGDTLHLFRTAVKRSTAGVDWPGVPRGFEFIRE